MTDAPPAPPTASQRLPRIGVMGAGAIGCFVGGSLVARGTADVTFVGRESLQRSVQQHGLRLIGFGRQDHIDSSRVRFETEPETLASCDVVMVAVKSGATADTARQIAPFIRDDAVIVSLQNGVRNAGVLRDELPGHRVVPGVVSFNVVMRDDATFVQAFTGPLVVETIDSDRPWVEALAAAGIDVRVENPIAPELWAKLLMNLNNSIAALSGATTPELLTTTGYRRLMVMALDEALSVLRAANIDIAKFRGVPFPIMSSIFKLPTPIVKLVLRAQLELGEESRASMWVDLERRRLTEVDDFNGEIVRVAESIGRDAPVNRRLVELVHEAERAGAGSPSLSPNALLSAVRG